MTDGPGQQGNLIINYNIKQAVNKDESSSLYAKYTDNSLVC